MSLGSPPAIGGSFGFMPLEIQARQQQEQSQIDSLMSQYAGICHCTVCRPAAQGGTANDVLKQIRAESYSDIMQHEMAHQSAAGAFGGGIVINFDGNGIATSGHVPIHFPELTERNAESNLQAYKTIYGAALAPSDPSGQDMAVAARASSLMGQAQVLMDRKRQQQQMGLSNVGPANRTKAPGAKPQAAGSAGRAQSLPPGRPRAGA